MGKANHLGDYLRARRARVTPAEVGLVSGPRRRLAGLRRDELAMLAGISSEYLQRLEQGRDRHPSAEVLDAIARALCMDAKATAHLHQLARPASRPHSVAHEHVSAAIAEWASAGANATQLALLHAATFGIADLAGQIVGQEGALHITIDADAAGTCASRLLVGRAIPTRLAEVGSGR